MDSMRSLNTSLPSARRRPQPPAQLLQAFKTAALQVTNLYKAAATDREAAHEEGYQAALEDMLSFLDNENLGVGDGEGWRVRQWVTEKLQEGMASGNHIDSDDENTNTNNTTTSSHQHGEHQAKPAPQRSSSPVVPHRTEEPVVSVPPPAVASVSPEPAHVSAPERPAFDATLPKGDFTFRAAQSLPAHTDLDMDHEAEDEGDENNNNNNATAPAQINVFPRHHGRANHHHHRSGNGINRSNHARDGNRNNAAATAAAVAQINSIGQGAGLKRRAPFGDFFDITGVGNGKDISGGGGKRGRFT
ncbi:uncharacterized protein BKCO1_2500043 [Diplodia corticola]|uniref:Uncharacterized protein n=1 Tax=Diplodia corticola TaxID=236234 RepID=A0A1J9QYJ7_9PEZI|nr:uncharacterized protein BKCO1_2500043 [Diplodia corticola]OJD34126.1 hypothetical protein BKCO1_2500043 [Diplodia corticola]